MSKFFSYFPKTFYISNNNPVGADTVTNIISRFKFEEALKENSSVFYPYQIQDGDTPEIIAHKYYNDPERHWIVLLFNDIVDPQFDWPLNQNSIIEYIDKKYTANGAANTTPVSGLAWAMSTNNVYGYYKVITTTANDGTQTLTKLKVDANTYANVTPIAPNVFGPPYTTSAGERVNITITKEKKTYYDYEIEENEKKREIKLLKKDFVSEVEKEFKRVISL